MVRFVFMYNGIRILFVNGMLIIEYEKYNRKPTKKMPPLIKCRHRYKTMSLVPFASPEGH